MQYGNVDARATRGYVGSYGTVGLLFREYVRCFFFPSSLGRMYPAVYFRFVCQGGWLQSLVHPEVRQCELRHVGVEMGRFMRLLLRRILGHIRDCDWGERQSGNVNALVTR